MSTPLERIAAAQGASLDRLRAAGADRALLVELVETSCLLELAKLEAARNDPASYLHQAADVIVQMYPVTGVRIEAAGPDMDPCCAESGDDVDGGANTATATFASPDGGLRGIITAGPLRVDLGSVDFFPRVAERIAAGLQASLETSGLRREVEADPLTGLGNRRRLDRALDAALGRAARFGESVAVILVDLDGFKHVNDTLGHEVGDDVLCAVGRAMSGRVRIYDEVVRLGGDEFVIVAPATDAFGAARLGELVRRSIRAACDELLSERKGADITVSGSVGVAIYPKSGADGNALLRAADAALYAAKRGGKDAVVVADAEVASPDQPAAGSGGGLRIVAR